MNVKEKKQNEEKEEVEETKNVKQIDLSTSFFSPPDEEITVSSEGSNLFAFKEKPEFKNIVNIANQILKFQPKK
mgnify:CR=1 FL=1